MTVTRKTKRIAARPFSSVDKAGPNNFEKGRILTVSLLAKMNSSDLGSRNSEIRRSFKILVDYVSESRLRNRASASLLVTAHNTEYGVRNKGQQ